MLNSHRSTSRSLTAIGIAAFLAFGTIPRPVAAEESKISSVEVSVNPKLAPVGGTVKISGRSGLDHKTSRTVKISVKAPDGKREDLTAEADQNGDFRLDFASTRDGDHIVDVTSPGGKDKGQTKFTVVGQKDMVEAVQTEQQALIMTAQDALETVETMLSKLPVSPAKDDVIEKLKPLKDKLAGLPSESAKLGPVMHDLDGVIKQSPAFGPIVYTSVFNPLAEWHREAGVQRKRIDAELALSRQANIRCDSCTRWSKL